MATSRVEYNGNLRTTCRHLKSGQKIITDAPTDNNGKGEAFSPTDLVATAYASCMLTVIGIHCDKNDIAFKNGHADVTKVMGDAPRRIARLEITLDLSGNGWDEELCDRIKRVAEACPVAKSVHPDIEIEMTYRF
ncbi:MAG: OsmC family protein [bacterium]|nr:OsmC family protein [bacterium]